MTKVSNLNDLNGRVSLITGGGGHLGTAMASALAEHGCRVALVDRDLERLVEAASLIGIDENDCFYCDLECEVSRCSLAERIVEHFGGIDILVNNAAFVGDSSLTGWATSFEQQSMETWRRAIEVNLTAPFHLVQLFANHLKASGAGSVINIASIYGILGPDWSLYQETGMSNPAGYAASKGGLVQLTRWLATTLSPQVRVNAISPGGIERGQPNSFTERYIARTPLGRMGREEDFAGIVKFLASDASSWVTGQNFVIDGGWSAW
jgi:NAD(P)-dependent dehydrogenase (short-subunit alcohol dehydrogenase family)